ncbi:MAG TPA: hypothetical protein VF782_01580 [Allosphingosinicella sp.]|jgi:hypothetical protein
MALLSTLFGRHGPAVLTLCVAAAGLAGCKQGAPTGNKTGAEPAAAAAAANPCGNYAPVLKAAIPEQTGQDQVQNDCAAWQVFFALNWRADPARPGYPDANAKPADFGMPGDMSPVVWETYLEPSKVFGGDAPLQGLWQAKRPAVKSLVRTSKFGALDLSSIVQAGSGDHWLTNQRGDVTYYEVMMNRDEYEFITTQNLTTAAGQLACAEQPGQNLLGTLRGGFNMPSGPQDGWDDTDCTGKLHRYTDGVGAMEIKAAWTPLPADRSLDYRYKTATALILDPVTKTSRKVTVGLVGLHIARKRFPRLPWIWATFEHIDNSPDQAGQGGFSPPALPANPNQRPSPGYTFFNPKCTPQIDPTYGCRQNFPPRPCGKGGICMPYNKPMQITRVTPVDAAANSATAYAWSLLPAKSVFNYYRLIGVQWPTGRLAVPKPGQRLPLPMGDPMPKGKAGGVSQILANTTLESFQQTTHACMDCHANFASIASQPSAALRSGATGQLRRAPATVPTAGQAPYAADYSFIFATETKR